MGGGWGVRNSKVRKNTCEHTDAYSSPKGSRPIGGGGGVSGGGGGVGGQKFKSEKAHVNTHAYSSTRGQKFKSQKKHICLMFWKWVFQLWGHHKSHFPSCPQHAPNRCCTKKQRYQSHDGDLRKKGQHPQRLMFSFHPTWMWKKIRV